MSENIQKQLNKTVAALRGARLCAVQALYQTELTGKAGKKVISEFLNHRISSFENDGEKVLANSELFQKLVEHTVKEHKMIDAQIESRLATGWTLERLDSVTLAALRCAVYELMNCLETPVPVIINEYVNIVSSFGQNKEAGFVNGILERIAKETKAAEARSA